VAAVTAWRLRRTRQARRTGTPDAPAANPQAGPSRPQEVLADDMKK
jgi:hypothetical protein